MAYKVVIQQSISDPGINFLKEKGYDVVIGDGKTDIETMKKAVEDADALLIRTAPYPKEVLECAKKVKVIGRMGVGLDNVDLDYCKKNGIWVTIAPQANSNAVAEHTIGFVFAAAHQTVMMHAETKAGHWDVRNTKKGRDVIGKTIGLVGFGRIGSLVAKKAALGLEMNIVAYDPYLSKDKAPEYVTMVDTIDELLAQSDFVSIHMPATPQTTGMVNKDFLSKMKPTAVLINCARGAIVNETDLYEALKNKIIASAALDVMVDEPANIMNPLFTLDNVTISPHNAGLTYETMDAMGLHAAMGIDDVLNGRIPQWPAVSIEK